MQRKNNSRRSFIKNTAGALAAFTIIPRHVLGRGFIPPSDQLTKAIVGVGGMGQNHIKYAGTTDSNGKAQLGGINPDSYYLFGVVRSGNGFAIWSSPVSIVPGENVLDLTPQSITEIDRNSGE